MKTYFGEKYVKANYPRAKTKQKIKLDSKSARYINNLVERTALMLY